MAFPEGQSEEPPIPFLMLSKTSGLNPSAWVLFVDSCLFLKKKSLTFACQQDFLTAYS